MAGKSILILVLGLVAHEVLSHPPAYNVQFISKGGASRPCDGNPSNGWNGNVEVEQQWSNGENINSWVDADVTGSGSSVVLPAGSGQQGPQIIKQNNGKPVIVYAYSKNDNNDNANVQVDTTQYVDSAQWSDNQQTQWSDNAQWSDNNAQWTDTAQWTESQGNEEVTPQVSDADCANNAQIKEKYGKTQVIKGRPETIVHKPSHIVVNQPPTKVLIHNPPLYIQPAPVIFHQPGKTVHRPVTHKYLPRPVQVRPVYVKVVRPIEKKVLVEKKVAEKPGCEQKVAVQESQQPGCEKTWVENGEAFQAASVVNADANNWNNAQLVNNEWTVSGSDNDQWAPTSTGSLDGTSNFQWAPTSTGSLAVTSNNQWEVPPLVTSFDVTSPGSAPASAARVVAGGSWTDSNWSETVAQPKKSCNN